MAKSASMYIRIDPEVKSDVEAIYSRYGMSITDAINIFLYTSRIVDGLPFDLRYPQPNIELLSAVAETGQIINEYKSGEREKAYYSSAREMFAAMDLEDAAENSNG